MLLTHELTLAEARTYVAALADRALTLDAPVRAEYVPIRGPLSNDILSIIRERPRPDPRDPRPPEEGRVSRHDLGSALEAQPRSTHPGYRGPGSGITPPFGS